MKKVKQPKPWISYTFECKECGDKIAYSTQSTIEQDTCGKCSGTICKDY